MIDDNNLNSLVYGPGDDDENQPHYSALNYTSAKSINH